MTNDTKDPASPFGRPVAQADLLRQAGSGNHQAMNQLFARYWDKLRWMVRLRLNRRH